MKAPISYYNFIFNYTFDFTKPQPDWCEQPYLRFQDLIVDPDIDHNESWPGPCGEDLNPLTTQLFIHERPFLSYRNVLLAPPDLAVVPSFDESGQPSYTSISDPSLGIESDGDLSGASSIAGVFYRGANFPEEYNNSYIQADITGWLRVFKFNDLGNIEKIEWWDDEMGVVVHMSWNPIDESIYMTGHFPGVVRKLTFAGNLRPVIEVSPDTIFGPGPLNVSFDASNSFDPEGTDITFEWNFDDGSTGTGAIVKHVFESESLDAVSRNVLLTVTDADGKVSQKQILVSLFNTPPQAAITGFSNGDNYTLQGPTNLNLTGAISDQETPISELDIEWRLFLHHNSHFHLEQI